ncbi:hypothetical protein TSUD_398370 [Trifolium subterraneum]|uniref:Uncharacterized protein n=1 Tax=Trifolium subterraneum TaxID=3900 RepID=A0A2Z6NAB3_TRISU|nr:hypothetical protein TSUD_398370 [Trifolium subterraneum]
MVRPVGLTMPEPVNTNTQKMEARLDVIGREMKSIKLTLSEMLIEQQKFHERFVSMLTKAGKITDDGERKIEASENRSTSEVHTTNGLKKLEEKQFEVPQQSVQEVIQQNQETVKEGKQSNVVQSRSGDDKSKFGEVVVDSRSLKCPVSIVLPPKALDLKPGITRKETQAACCSVMVSRPPKPPDADMFAVVMEIKHIGDVTNNKNRIVQILVAPTPPIEPPDTDACVVVTNRNLHASTTEKQVVGGPRTTPPPPEPPDAGSLDFSPAQKHILTANLNAMTELWGADQAGKITDDGERKIEASENRSTSEVHTTNGLKKLEEKQFEVPQQSVQEVIQQNQETVKEGKQSNVVQSRSGDDKSKFGEVVVDSRSLKCPVSIVLPPKALDLKPGITRKETQAACCSVMVSRPPKPPDADMFAVVMEIKHIGDVTNNKNRIVQILVAPTPPIEPPDTDACVVVTNRNLHASTTEKQVVGGPRTTPPPPEPPNASSLDFSPAQKQILTANLDAMTELWGADQYTLMPTGTVAMMIPISEALDYVFRKQVNCFNKDIDMKLMGQADNNVRFYFLPISAVYLGWQTLNFWVFKIEEGKVNSLPIKVMKFILLVTNEKYSKREITSSPLVAHTEISSMESIASGFVMLLEMVENATIKILDVPTMGVKVSDSLNLEDTISMLPPKFSGSEVLLAVKFFVADSLSVIQWDPGGKDSVLSDYFIRRISGECYYGAQVDFLKIWSVLKWCVVHVVIADFSVSVVATSSVFMFDCASGSVALCHAKATMRIVDVLNAQNSTLEVVHKETTSLLAKEPIGGNTYEMVLLTLYGSNTLHLWNFAWLVHLGNVDFSNFTSKDFGRHSVNQFDPNEFTTVHEELHDELVNHKSSGPNKWKEDSRRVRKNEQAALAGLSEPSSGQNLGKDSPYSEFFKNRTEEGPVILIIRRARLQKPTGYNKYYRYPLQVSNLWNVTKLIFNEDIAEINDFKKRLICSDSSLPADNTYGPQAKVMSFSPQRFANSAGGSQMTLKDHFILKLSDIIKLPKDEICITVVKTSHIQASDRGWYMIGCTSCIKQTFGSGPPYECGDKHPTTDPILRTTVRLICWELQLLSFKRLWLRIWQGRAKVDDGKQRATISKEVPMKWQAANLHRFQEFLNARIQRFWWTEFDNKLNNGIAIKPTEDSPSQSHLEAEISTPKQLKLMDSQDDADIPTIRYPISLPPKDQKTKKRKMLSRLLNSHQPSSSQKKNK